MKKEFLVRFSKGILISLLSGLVLLMAFAGIFSLTGSNKGLLITANIVIRMVSAIICAFFFCTGERGALKGLLAGFVSFLCMELLFLIFAGIDFNWKLLIELVFSLIFGTIGGIIFANLKNNPVNS